MTQLHVAWIAIREGSRERKHQLHVVDAAEATSTSDD